MARTPDTYPATAHQLSFDGPSKLVLLRKDPTPKLLLLSLSRLSSAASYYSSQEAVPDPKHIALPEHIAPIMGTIAHAIIQSALVWRNTVPTTSKNYKQEYQHRLATISPRLFPNTDPDSAKLIMDALSQPGCAMPHTTEDVHRGARFGVYQIIAETIIKKFKSRYPFTATLPFYAQKTGEFSDFPFPSPEKFNRFWHSKNSDDRLRNLVESIFLDHEENPHIVNMLGLILISGVTQATELRMSTYIPEIPAIFSARADFVTWGKQLKKPENTITVYDWKSGDVSVQNPVLEDIRQVSLHALAMMLIHFPKHKLKSRTVVNVKKALSRYPHNSTVVVNFRGYNTRPPSEATYGDYAQPLVASREEFNTKKGRLIEIIKILLSERPEIIKFFT